MKERCKRSNRITCAIAQISYWVSLADKSYLVEKPTIYPSFFQIAYHLLVDRFFFFYITFPPYFLSNCGHIFFFDSLLNSIKASFHGYFPWLRFISRYTGISWCNILLVAIIQRIVLRFKEKECFSKIEFHSIYASLSKISSNGLFSCYKVF